MWNNPGFREYHQRMQLFFPLYIEAGSYINNTRMCLKRVVVSVPRHTFLFEWLCVLPFLHINIFYTHTFHEHLRDARILSTITEPTENLSSRPTSYNLSVPGSRPLLMRSGIPLYHFIPEVLLSLDPAPQVVALGI